MRRKLVLVAVMVGIVSVVGFITRSASQFTCEADPYTVTQGDTLWAIAETKCDGNIQMVVDNLISTYGDPIHSGDVIWLPTESKCLLENRDGHIYDEC